MGLQLAMIAVGSCIGAFYFGSRQHRGSHWRRLIVCLCILAVGFMLMRVTMDTYWVLGIVELLAGLGCFANVCHRQSHCERHGAGEPAD